MSHTLFAFYAHPEDPAAFDRHYADTHSAIALEFPGLRRFTGTHLGPGPDGSPAPYYFVAALEFDDQQALDAALAGEHGAAAVADLANFAGAGVTLSNGSTTVYR